MQRRTERRAAGGRSLSSTEYGSLILDVLVGVGALLVGIGVFVGMLAFTKALKRLSATLDAIDRQVQHIGTPVSSTFAHVDDAAKSLGNSAATVSQTVELTRSALVPTIVNLGAAMSGVTAGLRRLVTGKNRNIKE
jgi:hypothetical protein